MFILSCNKYVRDKYVCCHFYNKDVTSILIDCIEKIIKYIKIQL